MICPNENCQKIVSSYDDQCPHCGTALKDHPAKKYIRETDRIVDEWQRRETKPDHVSRIATKPLAAEGLLVRNTEDLKALSGTIVLIMQQQWKKLLEAQDMIFNNLLVLTNDEWKLKAQRTFLWFNHENEEVNATATTIDNMEKYNSAILDLIEQSNGIKIRGRYEYIITIYGGYVNFAYAVASALLSDHGTTRFYDMEKLAKVIELRKEGGGKFGVLHILRLNQNPSLFSQYGSDAFMSVYECIAHELGHICYGHVHGPGYNQREAEANIGQEFDADSFAYSVIASSSFKKELWRGLIQFMTVQAALEILRGRSSSTTHPQTTERFKTAINRFQDLAAMHNVNEQWAEEMAYKLQNWLS